MTLEEEELHNTIEKFVDKCLDGRGNSLVRIVCETYINIHLKHHKEWKSVIYNVVNSGDVVKGFPIIEKAIADCNLAEYC